MSTKKVRDAVPKPATTTKTNKSKKPTESTKKESKPKTSSRIIKKEYDNEDEKKTILKTSTLNSTRKVSKPAPNKKLASTAKPTSSRAVTPPSSRVVKSQFFPSKNMYSNALGRNGTKKNIKPEPVTPKLNNINDVSPDTSSISERPRTATLRKGSIVNNNIVGPEAPKIQIPEVVKAEEPEYEDDFDSYESDFDEYNSSGSNTNLSTGTTSSDSESVEFKSNKQRISSAGTDDEKKLDSGNYELPEPRHRQILDNIKESIEKENANLNHEHNRSNLGSLSDEGFEEAKSLQFINFLGAQKKYQHRKSVQLRRKRGEEILSMIRLDQYSFTLYDLALVPYEVFIKYFGKSNSVQVSVQTGEDNINEEIQTEEIIYHNKWTQCPPTFTQIKETEHFWEIYKFNYLGVGTDVITDEKSDNIDENGLEKFILNSGNLILNLQAEANVRINAQNNKSNIPFSKSFVRYESSKVEILRNTTLKDVCFSSNNCNKIITLHGSNNSVDYPKSFVCLWNLSNVESPELILNAFGNITCCAFNEECPTLIFGGLTTGSIVIWDTKETSSFHKICNSENFPVRSPTYNTEVNYGHYFKIISIQAILDSTTEKALFSIQKSTEICSLDEDGVVIVWSVIFKEKSCGKIIENQGLAHWGSVILTINTKISLKNLHPEIGDFKCTDLGISYHDSNNLYISTSYGIIIHCLAKGGKTTVKKLLPDKTSQANCLEMCPYSSKFLLAGFDNGDINLYSRIIEKPLKILSNKDNLERMSKIEEIQWSHNRPFIFYSKDITNTIHVWNLKVSDLFPIYSIPFKDRIVCMKLSPIIRNISGVLEETYMIIAMENGLVYVHLLNEEHDQQSAENFQNDKEKLFNYINRYI